MGGFADRRPSGGSRRLRPSFADLIRADRVARIGSLCPRLACCIPACARRTNFACAVARHREVGLSRARGGVPEDLAVLIAGIGLSLLVSEVTICVSSGDGGRWAVRGSRKRRCRVLERGLERAGCGSQAVPRCGAIGTTGG